MGKGVIAKCLVYEDERIFVGKLNFKTKQMHVGEEAEQVVKKISADGKASVVVSFGQEWRQD